MGPAKIKADVLLMLPPTAHGAHAYVHKDLRGSLRLTLPLLRIRLFGRRSGD